MKQLMVVTILGGFRPDMLERITRVVRDAEADIVDCRLVRPGSDVSILLLLSGSWGAMARLEGTLPKLEKELDVILHFKRTDEREPDQGRLPYNVEIVTVERPDVIHEISAFMLGHGINICEFHTSGYQSQHSDARMLSLHLLITVPGDSAIPALRGDFMDLCDRLNLDAILEPAK